MISVRENSEIVIIYPIYIDIFIISRWFSRLLNLRLSSAVDMLDPMDHGVFVLGVLRDQHGNSANLLQNSIKLHHISIRFPYCLNVIWSAVHACRVTVEIGLSNNCFVYLTPLGSWSDKWVGQNLRPPLQIKTMQIWLLMDHWRVCWILKEYLRDI